MRNFGSILGLGEQFWCNNIECPFFHIKRYYSKADQEQPKKKKRSYVGLFVFLMVIAVITFYALTEPETPETIEKEEIVCNCNCMNQEPYELVYTVGKASMDEGMISEKEIYRKRLGL